MNLKPGLWQQQTLKLQMTQELSQAIALLQYSTQELASFLEEKAIENPLLKIEPGQTIDPKRVRSKGKVPKDKQSWIEQIGSENKTLDAYLQSQINMRRLSNEERIVIDELIYHIDENGYLCASAEEIATKLKTSPDKVEEGLTLIQELEPAGIGARDLKECLLLQLTRQERKHELAEKIIQDYFTLFAEKKWKELAKLLKVTPAEIQQVFDAIQVLNPRPASIFQRDPAVYIIPDVVIKWDGEAFSISVFDEALPKISFNDQYYKQFASHQDKQVGRFLQEKQQDYFWIVRALEQRKETLTKVAVKIVEKQQDFFTKGPSYLKPMTMKDISEELEIHESTVSRAVREKYAQTPFGLYDLKFFFSSTIQTTSAESASSRQVRDQIKTLIEQENKQKPLSDQEIVNALNEENGIVVSRRTIAKYRDQLGIPSSSKRKRYE
ncbi:RNA polymerase sigma-54 factor [Robertmurraya yapensis]|uniref:RNA polymerase sigma-54 factor n=2 Tax=Bacillaceae TaxID=186817 RepID=A0A3S0IIT5_9BACI|nr:RNA polymerase factor sigma-54 [Bacillus yapensis]RTR36244.1 RNA polymerase sigma-54 factor [Bacillus yapensis]TKT05747.1 RNA polymerase factor sigma-54 [Bacillus yapensis]